MTNVFKFLFPKELLNLDLCNLDKFFLVEF